MRLLKHNSLKIEGKKDRGNTNPEKIIEKNVQEPEHFLFTM
jgi:hypothetical protein